MIQFPHPTGTYRERAEHLRQTYGWTVPEPPTPAEPWLALGPDYQEHDEPPDRSRRWLIEVRSATATARTVDRRC